MTRNRFSLMVSLILIPLAGYPQASDTDDTIQLVREFLDAFNKHDAAAMSAHAADDIQWLSVREGETSIQLEGKAALNDAMRKYFASCATCRSEIKSAMASDERVSVVEVASWVGPNGQRSQQAMAVYEFSGSLIQRIYYFPEEVLPGKANP